VLTNNGSGGFVLASSPSVGNAPDSVCAADVNGDGKVDLISANHDDSTLTVLTNNGSGSFVFASTLGLGSVPGSTPFSVYAADVNGDGKVDLISANFGADTLTVLTNALALTPSTQIYSASYGASFTGNGGGLTNVNATTLGGSITANSFAALSDGLIAETNRATTAEGVLTANLNAEAARATAAENTLSTNAAQLAGANSFTDTNNFSGVTIATNPNNTFNGTFTGSGAGLMNTTTAGNYVFAYDTKTQSIISAGVFQDIKFSSIGQVNGWVHTSGSGSFTNTQSGLYLVQYSAELSASKAPSATVSMIGTLNGTEIPGSQCAVEVTAGSITTIAKAFLVSVAYGNTFKLKFTSMAGGAIAGNIGAGSTKPSVSCTIIRIQ